MAPQSVHRESGFSLLEVLVSLSIFLLVLFAIYQTFDTSQATYASGQKRVDVQQSARLAMDEMARRIRMAGYFPENFSATPPTPLLANGIQIATGQALAVYGDMEGNGASSVLFFCLDASGSLRRGGGAAGVAASYTCAGGEVLADNVTSLTFIYFDASNAQIIAGTGSLDAQATALNGTLPAFGTTTQRDAVQAIDITLTARESVGIPGKDPQDFTLTSSVRLRNRN